MSIPEATITALTIGIFLYLVTLQTITLTLIVIGGRTVRDYLRRRPMRDFREVARSSLSMAVTLMVPAYNEAATIRNSVNALFSNDYATFEVVVVNDGSTDDTLAALIDQFDLVPFQRAPRSGITTKPVIGTYASRTQPRLFVVDKGNGGKADSLNAALNCSRYPLVCALDADTLLDPQALSRIVWEFESHPETVAVGGIVRVANGSIFDGTRITRVRTPNGLLPNLQIMEYLRAFLGARIGWSKLNMLIIISGAFGVFRRDVLVEVGGYNTKTVGEDAELVLRLHRRMREAGRPYRITFFPDPICWTEVPTSLRVLARQRDRWQRGLGQMLAEHRDMFFRPRYRGIGSIAMPYFLVFEWFGPVVEVFGYVFVAFALVFGLLNVKVAIWFFGFAVLAGIALSFCVVIIEQHAYRRYLRWRDMAWLCSAAVLENLGYRQFLTLVRLKAMLLARRSGTTWGEMTRTGFSQSAEDDDTPTAQEVEDSPL